MKFGKRQASDDDSSYESCSENTIHYYKCYDISEIFATDTKRTSSLSKQSLDCVKTQLSTEPPSARSSSCKSASELTSSSSIKTRINWTIDLHEKFVECVNHLGGPMEATPKGILKLMRTRELTIYQVKSHLQSYRSLKRVQDFREGTRFKEEEIHLKGSRIKELMRLQAAAGQHLQEQLETQRELYLLVQEQNKQLHEMIKEKKEHHVNFTVKRRVV